MATRLLHPHLSHTRVLCQDKALELSYCLRLLALYKSIHNILEMNITTLNAARRFGLNPVHSLEACVFLGVSRLDSTTELSRWWSSTLSQGQLQP